jgi:hypothetical protein
MLLRSVLCTELGPRESLKLLYRHVAYMETPGTFASELGLHSASRGVSNVPGCGVGEARYFGRKRGACRPGDAIHRCTSPELYIVITFRLNFFLLKILEIKNYLCSVNSLFLLICNLYKDAE